LVEAVGTILINTEDKKSMGVFWGLPCKKIEQIQTSENALIRKLK
jgi:hypothetical protein